MAVARWNTFSEPKNEKNALTAAVAEIIGDFYVHQTNAINFYQQAVSKENEYRHHDMINEILFKMTDMDISVRLEDKVLMEKVSKKRVHNIVFVDSHLSFLNFFKNLPSSTFEYQGYYIIVLTTYTEDQYSVMSSIFEFLWNEYIINLNVIWKPLLNENEAYMYTYFPFTNFYCGKTYPVQLNQYSFGRWLNAGKSIFPNKMSNLHKCPLTAAVVPTGPFMKLTSGANGTVLIDGIDGTVVKALSQLMNFTLKVIVNSDQGGFLKNGTATGKHKILYLSRSFVLNLTLWIRCRQANYRQNSESLNRIYLTDG